MKTLTALRINRLKKVIKGRSTQIHFSMVSGTLGQWEHLKEGYVFPLSAYPKGKRHIAPSMLTSLPFAVSSLSDGLDFSDDDKAKDVDGDFSDLSLTGRDDQ